MIGNNFTGHIFVHETPYKFYLVAWGSFNLVVQFCAVVGFRVVHGKNHVVTHNIVNGA